MAIKVLCTTPYYEPAYIYGGPARSIPALCRALAQQNVEVTVFTTNANGSQVLPVPTGRPVDRDGVQVFYFPNAANTRYFLSPRLAFACFRESSRFDIIHANGFFNFSTLMAATAAHRRSIPLVISVRGELMPWALGYKRLKKLSYIRTVGRYCVGRAAALLCTDENEKQAVLSVTSGRPVYLIPNLMNVDPFLDLPARGRLRRQLRIPDGAFVIMSVGRLHPVKRPDLALKAFGRVARLYPDICLVFVGPDELGMATDLHAMAQQTGCADRVFFTGLVAPDDIPQALADADLFLSTSESENFGMAVAEAMLAGLPLVISERIGLSRLITDYGGGCVVALEPGGIADAITRLLQQPRMLQEIGRRAQTGALHYFRADVVARKTLECYTEVRNRYRGEH
jgi:glycosyltransferase involved in cell wall biosynthesis